MDTIDLALRFLRYAPLALLAVSSLALLVIQVKEARLMDSRNFSRSHGRR